ncbi:hypothetical protein ACFRR7_06390 [Streptomyces sp. NPDC056909]|uniref:AraC-like ligand-binding domain-containing protein n=1 Tax=Streptomyces sp. NPDC056909 TaxID=3345963 RepID=UPI0036911ED5
MCGERARLIRQSDPEQYHLSLMLWGTKRCAQDGRESRCEPYELHMADTSRPFSIEVADHCGEIALIGVEFPKALMPLPLDKVDRLVNRRLPGREGMGALLASFLTRLTQHTSTASSAHTPTRTRSGPRRRRSEWIRFSDSLPLACQTSSKFDFRTDRSSPCLPS